MLVLDPWGGSGTTGAVAARIGVPALCLDINPVMATFSAGKSLEVVEAAPDIENFFIHLAARISVNIECHPDDALLDIFDSGTARTFRSVIEAIPFKGHKLRLDDVEGPVALAVHDATHIINAAYAFCMAVVFVTIREISGMKTTANPTWLKTAEKKASRPAKELFGDLHRNAGSMLSDLRRFFQGRNAAVPSYVLAGHARKLPVKSRTVDYIVTSPPYLTRIDYAMSTAPGDGRIWWRQTADLRAASDNGCTRNYQE